jgi:Uncharacterized conserved protein
MIMKPNVIFIATYDTKGIESDFIKKRVEANGANCITVDVGVGGTPTAVPDVSLTELCKGSEFTVESIHAMPRGDAVAASSNLAQKYVTELFKEGEAAAIIGIGGAGGTQIATQTMRTMPFGLPKLMLSTLASGNTRWYLEDSDITMLPSITDVAGLNDVTEIVFDRFAALSAKAAQWYAENFDAHYKKLMDKTVLRIGQTMYGTTTKGVTNARKALESKGYETLVFHASGAGGRAMENFIRQGFIKGVLDMTIAEIGAYLVGGLHNAGPHRMEAAVEMGIPLVIVPGAADTIVLPPLSDLPDKFRHGRVLNKHNPTMTTMRTNVEENIQIGEFLVSKLKNTKSPVTIFIPKGGLSSIDKPGLIFYMPEASKALFETLKSGLKGTNVTIIEDSRHIDDPNFGDDASAILDEMMKKQYGFRDKKII